MQVRWCYSLNGGFLRLARAWLADQSPASSLAVNVLTLILNARSHYADTLCAGLQGFCKQSSL